jgi:serine/threonine-protein kinase
MAPEQIFGMPVGPATDLYALGCVAYWLLSGATPFESEEPGALLRMHAQSPPPPLAERAKQPIPPRLGALVMACLAKEPADRPADADRLRAALVDSIDGPPWSAADAAAWWASRANDGEPARPAADRRVTGDAGLQPAPGPVPRPPG